MIKIKWKNKDKEGMSLKNEGKVPYLIYPAMEKIDWIRHGFSTRMGGVSTGDFASMNLSYGRNDSPEAVSENYRRISHAIGFSPENIVTSDQTHTVNVRRVGKENCGSGIFRDRDFSDVDGLVTNEPQVVLTTFYADCVPLYFVDPVHHAIGLSHSGWRGTVSRMGEKTIEKMNHEFGTEPEDLITAIGPSICRACYEVSEDVISEVRNAFPADLWEDLFDLKGNGKYQLDLWECNRRILLSCGVREENINMPNLCTCCNPSLLFSHRASNGRRGNLAAFLMITE